MADQQAGNPNLPLINGIIDTNELAIKQLLKRLEQTVLKNYQAQASQLRSGVTTKYPGEMNKEQKLDKLIPFGDFTGGVLNKLSNAMSPRQLLINIISDLNMHPSIKNLTPEALKKTKEKFDLICDYDRREKEGKQNSGDMYTEDLCLYLLAKTFKKSSNETYESFFRVLQTFENEIEQKIQAAGECRIASLGGGSGADLIGAFAFVHDYQTTRSAKWQFTVYDVMAENWEKTAKDPITWGLYKPMQNGNNWTLKFEKVDFTDPATADKIAPDLGAHQIITVAWALNEAVFNADFWAKVLTATPNSLLVFVEGKDEQLEKIHQIAATQNRRSAFVQYENPRRLFVLPNAPQAAQE